MYIIIYHQYTIIQYWSAVFDNIENIGQWEG